MHCEQRSADDADLRAAIRAAVASNVRRIGEAAQEAALREWIELHATQIEGEQAAR